MFINQLDVLLTKTSLAPSGYDTGIPVLLTKLAPASVITKM